MRTLCSTLVAACFVALVPPALQGQAEPAEGVTKMAAEELAWRPVEGQPGAMMATLHGNPAESGHYILRFELPPNWSGRPHMHGGAELVTVHSGTCYMAHGEDLSREAAEPLSTGAFMELPAGTKMQPFTGEDGCVVDVQGQGPFTTTYLDEEPDPGS